MSSANNLGFHCHGLDHFDQAIIHNGLVRGEFYNFLPDELPGLRERIARHNLATSVHAPLERFQWYPSPPTYTFLCEADKKRRQLSLRMIEETMKQAQAMGADYVVVHFPSPGSDKSSGKESYDEAFEIAWKSAELMADMSQRYATPIHMEGFGPSPFLNIDFLSHVFTEFPSLSYCFDTGHMHMQGLQFGFDFYEFAKDIGKHIGSIHLWNNRNKDDYDAHRHISVHPSQRPEDGWGDIPRILQLVLSQNPTCTVIMESGLCYPKELGGHHISESVAWVKGLMAALP